MKKGLFKYIFLLFLFLIIPSVTFASEKIELKCNQNDELVLCYISGNSENELIGLEADISYSSNLELVKFTGDSVWLGDASNDKLGLYSLGTGDKEEFDIGTLQFKVKNNKLNDGFVTLNNLKISKSDYKWINLNSVTSNFDVKYSSSIVEKHELLTVQLILIIIGALLLLSLLFVIFLYCVKHINDESKIYIKRKQLIIFLSIMIIFIVGIYILITTKNMWFDRGSIDYTCNQYNDILQCKLYGNSNYEIAAVELDFIVDNGGEVEITNTYEWQNYFDDNKLDLFSSYDVKDEFNLCEFKIYDYKSDSDIVLKDITFIDKSGYNHLIDDINIKYGKE